MEKVKNIKKELENNLNEIKKTFEKIEELKQEKSDLSSEVMKKINDAKNQILNNEELKQYLEVKNEKEKKLCFDIDTLYYKNDILNNNIDLLLNEIVTTELYQVLKKYEGKKVGDKTKEKMQNELKEYVNINYDLDIYFSYYKEYDFSRDYKMSFDFYLKGRYVKVGKIEKVIYMDTNEVKDYYTSLNYDYIEIKDALKVANKILQKRQDSNKKIKELQGKIENIRQDYNVLCNNHLNNYRINLR